MFHLLTLKTSRSLHIILVPSSWYLWVCAVCACICLLSILYDIEVHLLPSLCVSMESQAPERISLFMVALMILLKFHKMLRRNRLLYQVDCAGMWVNVFGLWEKERMNNSWLCWCLCGCFCVSSCNCVYMRFAQGDPSWRDSVLTSPVLIYYSNCASSTLIQNGIAVTSISNSLLNCRHWDNQWTVNSETPGTVSTTHLQEMKHLISLRSYDQAHYSTTFMDKSDTEIAITPISHDMQWFGLISTVRMCSETFWCWRHLKH